MDWDSDWGSDDHPRISGYRYDPDAFVFSLVEPDIVRPVRHATTHNKWSIFCHPSCGPTFQSLQIYNSYDHFRCAFAIRSNYFTVAEVEVWGKGYAK